ncbi:uncharacterized protein I303_104015 [Kwoniella dejecticola CBS 10117]|uniref:Uncharacterized protein n=1 Tax=Kwoniella dejecticola CBS 10117 TaxID=1296121 RepID=A0A1A6A8C7_9TREE|nr:uncharacterized protein I303_04034 [Kwoniella dejecticola CBS 10117]OBR86310.1 hypothetical protein I303_04034 [Kwoniella dejecticola CBS 10117]
MVFELGIPSERKLDRRGKSTLLQSYIIEETRKFHGPYPYPYEDSQIKKYWVEITAKIQPRTYLHALGCQSKECVGYHLDEFPDIANTDELDEDQGKEQAKEPTGDTSNKDSEGRTICNPSRLLSELENDGDLRIQDETDLKEWLEEQSKIQGEGEGHVARVFKGYYIVKPWSDAYFFKPHGTHWTEYTWRRSTVGNL